MTIYKQGIADVPAADTQGRINIVAFAYASIGQGTWAWVVDASQIFGFNWQNIAAAADGDNISYNVYLDAGTYKLWMLGYTAVGNAITDIDINGTEIASFDWYSAGNVYNVLKSQAGISVSTAGRYTLKVRIDGRNASADAWATYYTVIILERTA